MTKEQPKPSDQGDDALAWERDEQEKLPPRGAGSVHNQGEDKGPGRHEAAPRTESRVDEDTRPIPLGPAGTPAAEFHSGGTRGPSNDNRG